MHAPLQCAIWKQPDSNDARRVIPLAGPCRTTCACYMCTCTAPPCCGLGRCRLMVPITVFMNDSTMFRHQSNDSQGPFKTMRSTCGVERSASGIQKVFSECARRSSTWTILRRSSFALTCYKGAISAGELKLAEQTMVSGGDQLISAHGIRGRGRHISRHNMSPAKCGSGESSSCQQCESGQTYPRLLMQQLPCLLFCLAHILERKVGSA